MRYKTQVQTKLEGINNQLLSIIKGLDTQTLTAQNVITIISDVRTKVEALSNLVELEPDNY